MVVETDPEYYIEMICVNRDEEADGKFNITFLLENTVTEKNLL